MDGSDLSASKDGMKSYGKSLLMDALNFAKLATSFQRSASTVGIIEIFLANSATILASP
jgi:hypothetical protein